MRIIVCGGRDYHDYEYLIKTMDQIHKKYHISMLIEGGCRGADSHAAIWADNNLIPRVTCHANWQNLGNNAEPIRNKVMLSLNPQVVIAFPGGRETDSMIKQAKEANIKVWRPGT